jgi:hypothetical protein
MLRRKKSALSRGDAAPPELTPLPSIAVDDAGSPPFTASTYNRSRGGEKGAEGFRLGGIRPE